MSSSNVMDVSAWVDARGTRVEELVHLHEVWWNVLPSLTTVSGRCYQVGFDVQLHGVSSERCTGRDRRPEAVTPIMAALFEIARWVAPAGWRRGGSSALPIQVVYSGAREREGPGARVVIEVVNRMIVPRSLHPLHVDFVRAIKERLIGAGARADSWR